MRDLVAIFKADEAIAGEIVTNQERTSGPGVKEFLIYGRDALLLGTLPGVVTAMGEAVRDLPRFNVVSVRE